MSKPGSSRYACVFCFVTTLVIASCGDAADGEAPLSATAGRAAASDAGAAEPASDAGRDAAVATAAEDKPVMPPESPASADGGTPARANPGAGSSVTAPPVPPVPPVEPLAWQACGDAGDECAVLQVPSDYTQPAGDKLQLAVKRRQARGQRLGVLVVNFGGPGVSGVRLLSSFVENASALSERFDVVTVDPRGVGASKPIVDCRGVDTSVGPQTLPTNDAEWQALDQLTKSYAEACAAKNTGLLSHIGTWDGARDLDRLREALGEETLSYYGVSYGTALGSRYAELYPKRVRAMVLDATMNDGLSRVELTLQEGKATEAALGHFFAACDVQPSSCGAWARGRPAALAFQQLADMVVQGEVRDTENRALEAIDFFSRIRDALASGEPGWAALNRALAALVQSDAPGFVQALTPGGFPGDDTYDNGGEAFAAIGCFDMPVASSDEVHAQLERIRFGIPHFGLLRLLDLLVCAHWPAKDLDGSKRIPHSVGAPPIVVIGTSGDPATPYDWAVAQAMHFEDAVLLTYQGEGHGAFGAGSVCIDDAVDNYLLSLTLPEERTRCVADTTETSWQRITPMRAMP